MNTGYVMLPFGPQRVIQREDGVWCYPDGAPLSFQGEATPYPVFSTEAAALAGREPGKRNHPRRPIRAARTHAAMTAEKDEDEP